LLLICFTLFKSDYQNVSQLRKMFIKLRKMFIKLRKYPPIKKPIKKKSEWEEVI